MSNIKKPERYDWYKDYSTDELIKLSVNYNDSIVRCKTEIKKWKPNKEAIDFHIAERKGHIFDTIKYVDNAVRLATKKAPKYYEYYKGEPDGSLNNMITIHKMGLRAKQELIEAIEYIQIERKRIANSIKSVELINEEAGMYTILFKKADGSEFTHKVLFDK